MTGIVRIGSASAFWGDSFMAAPQLVRSGAIDYLVFDYLAEITMSVMARARQFDPNAGYATDFVSVTMKSLAREIAARKIKVVANAGGVNPKSCAAALEKVLAEQGVKVNVAYVEGDDILPRLAHWRDLGIKEIFTGAALPAKLLSMNAYLGAFPVAEALAMGADIVITGRCVDSAVTLGPLIHEFGWKPSGYDLLAQGSLCGHLIECGAQATGGLYTDWRAGGDWADIGYPIAEVAPDGTFAVTKPEGTGGLVTPATLSEQLVYEIGDPQAYLLPDVVCDFAQVTMRQLAKDRVEVKGARGYAPTSTYKVSATYEDGYRVAQYVTIGGMEAAAKARATGNAVLRRLDAMLRERNLGPYTETSLEVIGDEDSYGPHKRPLNSREVVLKLAAKHPKKEALDLLVRELTSSATSMAPGTGGIGGNRPKVSQVARLFSCLVPKADVPVTVHLGGESRSVKLETSGGFDAKKIVRPKLDTPSVAGAREVPLVAIAHGRSGDKGNHSNIGIVARKPEYLPYIRAALTEKAVADWFAYKIEGAPRVTRWELPGIHALNFLVENALGGGGIASLSNDPQGKAYAQILLEFPVPVSDAIAREVSK